MRSRADLHDFQEAFAEFVNRRRRVNGWIDVGLGKTAGSLTAYADLIDKIECRRWLVIAPVRVARFGWPTEIQKWHHVKHLRIRVLQGTPEERLQALLDRRADIHVINRELLPWLYRKIGGLKNFPYDGIIFDESSQAKNADTKTFKILKAFSQRVHYWINLTATPAPNSCLELWTQTYLLDHGKRLSPTLTSFRQRWGEQDPYTGLWAPKNGAAEEIQRLLGDITFRLDGKDYLKLPERIDRFVSVELEPDQMRAYKEFEKKHVLELEDETITAKNAMALVTKQLQFANGCIYDSEKNAHPVHEQKIEALRQIVEEAQGEPILVAYWFKTDLARLQHAFPQGRVLDKKPETMRAALDGEIPVLFMHPQAGGHGLDGLQHVMRYVVWFSLHFSLELYLQLNGRIERQGQVKPVTVFHLVTQGTVDETALATLQRKQSAQDGLLLSMKRTLDEYRRQ